MSYELRCVGVATQPLARPPSVPFVNLTGQLILPTYLYQDLALHTFLDDWSGCWLEVDLVCWTWYLDFRAGSLLLELYSCELDTRPSTRSYLSPLAICSIHPHRDKEQSYIQKGGFAVAELRRQFEFSAERLSDNAKTVYRAVDCHFPLIMFSHCSTFW